MAQHKTTTVADAPYLLKLAHLIASLGGSQSLTSVNDTDHIVDPI